jgi:fructose-1,6-bisphosphatase/sedoheptulose 1,7-bisphosphatase-like protein
VTEIVARLAAEQGVAVTPERATQLVAIGRRLNDTTCAAADRQAILADPATYLHTLASLRQDEAV